MVAAVVAVLVILRAGIRSVTVAVQPGAGLSDGQVLPGSVEVTKLTRRLSPGSGLLTVTV